MNLLAREKYYIFCILLVGAGSVVLFYYFVIHENAAKRMTFEIATLEGIDPNQAEPVDEETLALNPLRKEAGLVEISTDWEIARSRFLPSHGFADLVVLNEYCIPVKIIETGKGWFADSPKRYSVTEYDLVDEKRHGRAAKWLGKPERLYTVQTYQSGVLNGPTIYYSEDGKEICRCEFLDGKPWTGRALQRGLFDSLQSDVSYKNGQLHGEEKSFEEGKLDRLRTFKNGNPDGLQQQYQKGQLRSERVIENGLLKKFTSWHQNGQLQWQEKYDHEGKRDGIRWGWDESGVLTTEENYVHGKKSGPLWLKGRNAMRRFGGEDLLNGESGKDKSERREAIEKK